MASLRSSSDLLVQGLIEELYRRRAALGVVTAMGLVLAATAIGLQIWAPAAERRPGENPVQFEPAPLSTPAAVQPGPAEGPELWITPNSASGARVWVRSDASGESPISASE